MLCERCNELETLPDMLVNCTAVRDFWNIVLPGGTIKTMKFEHCTIITPKIVELEFLIIFLFLQKDTSFYGS